MPKDTNTTRGQADAKKQSINKGIELMLPRSTRRIEEPKSTVDLDFTLPFLRWRVRLRVKLDITGE